MLSRVCPRLPIRNALRQSPGFWMKPHLSAPGVFRILRVGMASWHKLGLTSLLTDTWRDAVTGDVAGLRANIESQVQLICEQLARIEGALGRFDTQYAAERDERSDFFKSATENGVTGCAWSPSQRPSEPPFCTRPQRSLDPVPDVQFPEYLLHVGFDSVFAEVNVRGDLAVGVASGDEPKDLELGVTQWV